LNRVLSASNGLLCSWADSRLAAQMLPGQAADLGVARERAYPTPEGGDGRLITSASTARPTPSGLDLSGDMALDLRSHAGRQQDQTLEFLLRLSVGALTLCRRGAVVHRQP